MTDNLWILPFVLWIISLLIIANFRAYFRKISQKMYPNESSSNNENRNIAEVLMQPLWLQIVLPINVTLFFNYLLLLHNDEQWLIGIISSSVLFVIVHFIVSIIFTKKRCLDIIAGWTKENLRRLDRNQFNMKPNNQDQREIESKVWNEGMLLLRHIDDEVS